jgi:hypothetical protein
MTLYNAAVDARAALLAGGISLSEPVERYSAVTIGRASEQAISNAALAAELRSSFTVCTPALHLRECVDAMESLVMQTVLRIAIRIEQTECRSRTPPHSHPTWAPWLSTTGRRDRVNGGLRPAAQPSFHRDDFDDVLAAILSDSCRTIGGARRVWCRRAEATHLALCGVGGALAPNRILSRDRSRSLVAGADSGATRIRLAPHRNNGFLVTPTHELRAKAPRRECHMNRSTPSESALAAKVLNVLVTMHSDDSVSLACEFSDACYHVWLDGERQPTATLYKNPPLSGKGDFHTRRLRTDRLFGRRLVAEMLRRMLEDSLYEKAAAEFCAKRDTKAREASERERQERIRNAAPDLFAALKRCRAALRAKGGCTAHERRLALADADSALTLTLEDA